MCWTEGRIDFAALQRRLYPVASRAHQLSVELPAAYVVFDLLAVDGTDIRRKPYSARRAQLEALLARQLLLWLPERALRQHDAA